MKNGASFAILVRFDAESHVKLLPKSRETVFESQILDKHFLNYFRPISFGAFTRFNDFLFNVLHTLTLVKIGKGLDDVSGQGHEVGLEIFYFEVFKSHVFEEGVKIEFDGGVFHLELKIMILRVLQ